MVAMVAEPATVLPERHTAMQLIQLERDDWNFFCPATGEPVFKETGEPNAATVRGVLVP